MGRVCQRPHDHFVGLLMSVRKYLKQVLPTSEETGLEEAMTRSGNDQISQRKHPDGKRVQQNKLYHSSYSNSNECANFLVKF